MSKMASRFAGQTGEALLHDVLCDESVFRGTPELTIFISGCHLQEVPAGTQLILQGESDNDLYVIISGSFSMEVNGRHLTTRTVGHHIGEVALIDPTVRRTATARAAEHSLVLRCSEEHFTRYANAYPRIWRRLAVELSRRLSERNALIRAPRTQPVMFLASSSENIYLMNEVQAAFDHDPIVVERWVDGVFNTSNTPIEDLASLIARIDFAVVIVTPDDKINSRQEESFGPRDNVIFELGLAIGAIGRARTMVLIPRGTAIKIPSDLLGVKPIDFPPGERDTLKSRLGPACHEIRKTITRLGPL